MIFPSVFGIKDVSADAIRLVKVRFEGKYPSRVKCPLKEEKLYAFGDAHFQRVKEKSRLQSQFQFSPLRTNVMKCKKEERKCLIGKFIGG
jgi:hypothetical protein